MVFVWASFDNNKKSYSTKFASVKLSFVDVDIEQNLASLGSNGVGVSALIDKEEKSCKSNGTCKGE